MNVTAIIIAYNEDYFLPLCVSRIRDYVTEIIVVDGSPFGPGKPIDDLPVDMYLTGVFQKFKGLWDKVEQVKAGINAATCDYLMVLSADMLLGGDIAMLPQIEADVKVIKCSYVEFWLDSQHLRMTDGDVIVPHPLIVHRDILYGNSGFYVKNVSAEHCLICPTIMVYHLGWIRPFPDQIRKHIRNIKQGLWGEIGEELNKLTYRELESWVIRHVLGYSKEPSMVTRINGLLDDKSNYLDGFDQYVKEYEKRYGEDFYVGIMRTLPREI